MEDTTKNKKFVTTMYPNVWADTGTACDLYDWLPMVRDGKYKNLVNNIRSSFAEGNDDRVSMLKHKLPAICPCGYLPEGRKKDSPMQLSELMWLDYDDHNRERSEKRREMLKGVKGMVASYLTPRFGLRGIVKLPSSVNFANFDLYCQVVFDYVDNLIGCKHDEQASTRIHLSSLSYDPDMWFLPREQVEDFPVEEMLKNNEIDLFTQLDTVGPETEEDFVMEQCEGNADAQTAADAQARTNTENGDEAAPQDEDKALQNEVKEAFRKLSRQDKTEFSLPQIDGILANFASKYPLVRGSRNKNLLWLGKYAYFKRMSRSELEALTRAAYGLMGCKEYNEKEIRRRLCWGYTHCDKQQFCKTNVLNSRLAGSTRPNGSNGSNGPNGPLKGNFYTEPIKVSGNQPSYSEVVASNCPFIPQYVYDHLPEFFKNLIFETGNRRDMDMAMVGNIAAAGGCMPKVTVQVRDQEYFTNLFFIGVAPAGSGKSIVGKSRKLYTHLRAKFEADNQARKREYNKLKAQWDLEQKIAAQQNRVANYDLEPAPFVEKEIIHPSQTSRSALIHAVAANPNGINLLTTELDTLNESLNCDCGKHSAELRCLASNEPIESSYVTDKTSFIQDRPCGTLIATGTPDQLVSFIGNTHDGMESRCLIMLGDTFPKWISWADYDEKKTASRDEAYSIASMKLADIYEFLEQHPTHVVIPRELRKECDHDFSEFTERLKDYHYDNLRCIVNRCPIHVARICAILAALRKYEMGYEGLEIEATKEDLIVAKGIVMTLLKHSCLATTMFVEDGRQANAIRNIFTEKDVFNNLPNEFTTVEASSQLIKEANFSEKSISHVLKRWVTGGYIRRVVRSKYVKTGKVMSAAF